MMTREWKPQGYGDDNDYDVGDSIDGSGIVTVLLVVVVMARVTMVMIMVAMGSVTMTIEIVTVVEAVTLRETWAFVTELSK